MINNQILELVYEPSSAVEFMEKCPLTLGGLKKLFLIPNDWEKDYQKYLDDNEYRDGENSLFDFLNDKGYSDEEVIEAILENEKEEYYIEFVDDYNEGYWEIYKIKTEYIITDDLVRGIVGTTLEIIEDKFSYGISVDDSNFIEDLAVKELCDKEIENEK